MGMLPAVVRSQLVDDALAASRAGILGYDVAFDVVKTLENETDYLVWDAAINNLGYIHDRMYNDESFNVRYKTISRILIKQRQEIVFFTPILINFSDLFSKEIYDKNRAKSIRNSWHRGKRIRRTQRKELARGNPQVGLQCGKQGMSQASLRVSKETDASTSRGKSVRISYK